MMSSWVSRWLGEAGASCADLPGVDAEFTSDGLLEPLLRVGAARLDLGDERFRATHPSRQRQLRHPQPSPRFAHQSRFLDFCVHVAGTPLVASARSPSCEWPLNTEGRSFCATLKMQKRP